MKKTIRIFLVLIVLFSLVACGKKLDAPTNVKITGNVVTWNESKKATSYVIKVGSNEYPVSTNSFDLSSLSLSPGTYQVSVKAVGNANNDSNYSTAVSYVVIPSPTLATPTNVTVTNGVMSWDMVENAVSYVVTVNGMEIETEELSLNLIEYVTELGNYPVTVKAKGTGGTYSNPAQVTLSVDQDLMDSLLTEMASTILILNDQNLGKTEDDFEAPYDYERYLEMVEEAYGLAETFIDYGVLLNTVKYVVNVYMSIDLSGSTLEIVKAIIEDYDSTQIAVEQLAKFLLGITKVAMEIPLKSIENMLDNLDDQYSYYEELLEFAQEQMEDALANLDQILENASPELDEYIALLEDYRQYIITFYNQSSRWYYGDVTYLTTSIEKLVEAEYELQRELDKGEDANPDDILFYRNKIDSINDDIDFILTYFTDDIDLMPDFIETIKEKYYMMYDFKVNNPHSGTYIIYDNYYFAIKNELIYYYAVGQYELSLEYKEEAREVLLRQYSQFQMMMGVIQNSSTIDLLVMIIDQALAVVDELNWDLIDQILLAIDEGEIPESEVLAGWVQEVVRLLRVATDFDQEEFFDKAIQIVLGVMPELSEDMQLAIRIVVVQTLPEVINIILDTLSKIDKEVIDLIFTIQTTDSIDKVNPEADNYVQLDPDTLILAARIYEKVLHEGVLALIDELESGYNNVSQVYQGIPQVDIEAIKNVIMTLDTNMLEIAGFEIITEGYYPDEQFDKMLETVTLIIDLISNFMMN